MASVNNTLNAKLRVALASRDQRLIRRRLPDPAASPKPQSQASPSFHRSDQLIDFSSNDYLSLSLSSHLRSHFLAKLHAAPSILGSGGSRLLINGVAHSTLEGRLTKFFSGPHRSHAPDHSRGSRTGASADAGGTSMTALLFNSGYDANVGFFSCIPQSGDIVVYDEYIHASVHDGLRTSRVGKEGWMSFEHNCLRSFEVALLAAFARAKTARRDPVGGQTSVFIAVESVYSMDGTFAPLREMVELVERVFGEEGKRNVHLVVDEAHATGVYGPQGRGRVAELGLEGKVLARLHTFGKALAASGAALLTSELVRDYMLNYARSLIYTTSLSYANIIAADASFDMLVDGTAQKASEKLLSLSSDLIHLLQTELAHLPSALLSLPPHLAEFSFSHPSSVCSALSSGLASLPPAPHPAPPIIPLLTPHPRALSTYLLTQLNVNARPITWPTVPKGKDRIRICLHAGNERWEVERLVRGIRRWGEEWVAREAEAERLSADADADAEDSGPGLAGQSARGPLVVVGADIVEASSGRGGEATLAAMVHVKGSRAAYVASKL